jgi:mono/diheme cytochrome c family protein
METPSQENTNPSTSVGSCCTSRRFRSGLVCGLLIMLVAVVLLPLIVAATGMINVSAQHSFGPIDTFLGYASKRSIAYHATDQTNPHANDPEAIADALPHYLEMCVVCHGAPGLDRSEIAEGLHPEAPDLASDAIQKMTDGQLFWVIANGIGSTGMPAFEKADDADTRWKIVSFVRHLPTLTDAERDQLKPAEDDDHHHHPDADAPGEDHPHGLKGAMTICVSRIDVPIHGRRILTIVAAEAIDRAPSANSRYIRILVGRCRRRSWFETATLRITVGIRGCPSPLQVVVQVPVIFAGEVLNAQARARALLDSSRLCHFFWDGMLNEHVRAYRSIKGATASIRWLPQLPHAAPETHDRGGPARSHFRCGRCDGASSRRPSAEVWDAEHSRRRCRPIRRSAQRRCACDLPNLSRWHAVCR